MTHDPGRAGWGVRKLALALYPFGAGAVAINLFMAGLFAPMIGLPTIPPGWSVLGGAIFGVPATWAFARHIRSLMDRADGTSPPRR
ncbi:NnrT protein [Oceaniglobus ichthyenteri]|uniref:NnrT protein n=1 Tax=Oceaniglobus ichthyenteri TaxID=2136177 RepID=UPI000D3A29D5|nr:NnrT protein [Oceaniglobus ichthyenteri]